MGFKFYTKEEELEKMVGNIDEANDTIDRAIDQGKDVDEILKECRYVDIHTVFNRLCDLGVLSMDIYS